MGYGTIDTIKSTARLIEVGSKFLGDYEWAQITVWYHPTEEKYFWYSDHGNSTTYYGERVSTVWDFENGDKDDALRAVRRFADSYSHYSYNRPVTLDELWNAVWTFRPEDAVLPPEPELKEGESYIYGVMYQASSDVYEKWGFDEGIIAKVIEGHGKVILDEFDYIPTKIATIKRRVLGVPETVWNS